MKYNSGMISEEKGKCDVRVIESTTLMFVFVQGSSLFMDITLVKWNWLDTFE